MLGSTNISEGSIGVDSWGTGGPDSPNNFAWGGPKNKCSSQYLGSTIVQLCASKHAFLGTFFLFEHIAQIS